MADVDVLVPAGLERRWWHDPSVRWLVGLATFAVFASPVFWLPPYASLEVPLPYGASFPVTRQDIDLFMALPLLPLLRQASYRKRDVLLICLVPVYGYVVAGKVVSRLMARPRRDWPPRPDELPRVVRIPGAPGSYLLLDTFSVAEQLRTRWCRNPLHQHPYDSWALAHQVGCRRSGPQQVSSA